MANDEARSERERAVARLVDCRERGTILNDRELHYAMWDAAIDAAAKCIREFDNDGDVVSRASQVTAILALKGDRNVEQSG